jgi:hypothetical protein
VAAKYVRLALLTKEEEDSILVQGRISVRDSQYHMFYYLIVKGEHLWALLLLKTWTEGSGRKDFKIRTQKISPMSEH